MSERQALREGLYGASSHLHVLHALEGLAPAQAGARVGAAPHTIFQILGHMVYWQDLSVARLSGERPELPGSSALGWRTRSEPEDASEWEALVTCLAEGLRSLEQLLADDGFDLDGIVDRERGTTARQELLSIQAHNDYHLGQIVTLRQSLSAWPPPRGSTVW